MENLLGKFYVLIKCCICNRSVYAASGLNTVPLYSCVGYSSLHCIELWPLSCHGWSADFLIWCSQHLIALRAQLCSSATKTSFKKSLQETLSIFCGAVLLLTFAFMVYCIKTAILKFITGAFKGNVYENEFNVLFSKLVHVQVFGSPNLPHCSEQGLYGNGWPSPLFSNRTFTRGNKNAEMFNDKIAKQHSSIWKHTGRGFYICFRTMSSMTCLSNWLPLWFNGPGYYQSCMVSASVSDTEASNASCWEDYNSQNHV